jgi:hypothetical protein
MDAKTSARDYSVFEGYREVVCAPRTQANKFDFLIFNSYLIFFFDLTFIFFHIFALCGRHQMFCLYKTSGLKHPSTLIRAFRLGKLRTDRHNFSSAHTELVEVQHAVGLLSSHTILLTHLLTQLRIMGARI